MIGSDAENEKPTRKGRRAMLWSLCSSSEHVTPTKGRHRRSDRSKLLRFRGDKDKILRWQRGSVPHVHARWGTGHGVAVVPHHFKARALKPLQALASSNKGEVAGACGRKACTYDAAHATHAHDGHARLSHHGGAARGGTCRSLRAGACKIPTEVLPPKTEDPDRVGRSVGKFRRIAAVLSRSSIELRPMGSSLGKLYCHLHSFAWGQPIYILQRNRLTSRSVRKMATIPISSALFSRHDRTHVRTHVFLLALLMPLLNVTVRTGRRVTSLVGVPL